ncbi:hypothetical protein [Flavobacterium enshiense]|uniref:Uncharacterized protein n=1 Tax=Flavobacterium enshiense DK69 TaxID=1107311 RepID=A0A0A2MSM1_9FLAO|nr:hypothetical protein [Flavobacterium enshiense]KGO94473.1 hypothetical protein Q767_12960 [Flavobacterium enshiense DK69]
MKLVYEVPFFYPLPAIMKATETVGKMSSPLNPFKVSVDVLSTDRKEVVLDFHREISFNEVETFNSKIAGLIALEHHKCNYS